MTTPVIEVRVPTFNRPAMLKRALDSLIRQTHKDWCCKVLDDGQCEGVRDLIDEFNDSRISYIRNPIRYGSCGNLNQAFSAQDTKSDYLTILEDDNFFKPRHFEELLIAFETTSADVIFSNQFVFKDSMGSAEECNNSTLEKYYDVGVLSASDLYFALYLGPAISNGALAWRCEVSSDFRVSPQIKDPVVQEFTRILKVRGKIAYIDSRTAGYNATPEISGQRAKTLIHQRTQRLRRQMALFTVRERARQMIFQQGQQWSDQEICNRYRVLSPVDARRFRRNYILHNPSDNVECLKYRKPFFWLIFRSALQMFSRIIFRKQTAAIKHS